MKPKACINCGKNIWIDVIQKDDRSELDRAFDGYCKSCKAVAQRTSNIVTRKRIEQKAKKQLDLEEVTKLRRWL